MYGISVQGCDEDECVQCFTQYKDIFMIKFLKENYYCQRKGLYLYIHVSYDKQTQIIKHDKHKQTPKNTKNSSLLIIEFIGYSFQTNIKENILLIKIF